MYGVCGLYILMIFTMIIVFFFFQAEDGIRDKLVTGVQTCALPICSICYSEDERISGGHQTREGLLRYAHHTIPHHTHHPHMRYISYIRSDPIRSDGADGADGAIDRKSVV